MEINYALYQNCIRRVCSLLLCGALGLPAVWGGGWTDMSCFSFLLATWDQGRPRRDYLLLSATAASRLLSALHMGRLALHPGD